MDAQEGHVARRERPLGQELDGLGAGEPVEEEAGSRPRAQERVDLEGDHGPGVEPQRARVLGEVGQQVAGVEEAHHGHASGHVHGVHVVAVDEGVEGTAGRGGLGRGLLGRGRGAEVGDGQRGPTGRGGARRGHRTVAGCGVVQAGSVLC